MFIDTHCHLDMMVQGLGPERPLTAFELENAQDVISELDAAGAVVEASVGAGVTTLITIGSSLITSQNAVVLARRYPNVYAVVGLHPCDATQYWKKDFEEIKKLVVAHKISKIVGIGETGLDFFHKPYDVTRQTDVFKAHIELALLHGLPLVLHIRDATDEALKILEPYAGKLRGVLHCFTHASDVASLVTSWGFLLGVGGPVTYPKNNELRAIVSKIPLGSIVLETDAPFLPPQPYRGKPNSPVYIPLIVEEIARVKNISVEEVARVTTNAARKLFCLQS